MATPEDADRVEELIHLVQQGDHAAFEDLLLFCAPSLAWSLRRHRHMAIRYHTDQDIWQELRLAIWKYLPDFEYQGYPRFRSWTDQIARSVMGSHERKAIGRKKHEVLTGFTSHHAEIPRKHPGPRTEAGDREQVRRVQIVLDRLPPLHRNIIALMLQEITPAEIQRILELPRSTNHDHTKRAKKAFSRLWKDLALPGSPPDIEE